MCLAIKGKEGRKEDERTFRDKKKKEFYMLMLENTLRGNRIAGQ
jgi:hypothetical protein